MAKNWIQHELEILTPWPFEGDADPGECPRCSGLGYTLAEIDEEKFPVEAPCWMCRKFCPTCNRWERKATHDCFKRSSP
jgi:hypothetical protein